MTTETRTRTRGYATAHVEATCTPSYHCPQAGGRMSVSLTGDSFEAVTIYVTGTRSEIAAWALAIRDEAIRGEEGD